MNEPGDDGKEKQRRPTRNVEIPKRYTDDCIDFIAMMYLIG